MWYFDRISLYTQFNLDILAQMRAPIYFEKCANWFTVWIYSFATTVSRFLSSKLCFFCSWFQMCVEFNNKFCFFFELNNYHHTSWYCIYPLKFIGFVIIFNESNIFQFWVHNQSHVANHFFRLIFVLFEFNFFHKVFCSCWYQSSFSRIKWFAISSFFLKNGWMLITDICCRTIDKKRRLLS